MIWLARRSFRRVVGVLRFPVSLRRTATQAASEDTLVQRSDRWRTGCEGRISVLKRRHGIDRSRYKGSDGMKRWVGLGVIADINVARAMTAASTEN
jgi:IS5 family transposase